MIGKFSVGAVWLAIVVSLTCPSVQAQALIHGVSAPQLITQAIDESLLVQLAGNTRPEANAENDQGLVADTMPMPHMLLQLRRSPQQEQALVNFIDGLTDPKSANYHQWLSPAQYGSIYGLAQQDLDTITAWLGGQGFTVNAVYPNGVLIDFSGNAGQVQQAFHTEIHNLLVNGEAHIANMSDPEIPAALAPAVLGVVSLNDFKPHAASKVHSDYTTSSSANLVVPADLATIYDLNSLFSSGISGQGQTIALIEDSDLYSTSDWTTFRSTFGLSSSFPNGSFTTIHPGGSASNCTDPGTTEDAFEATLDAEWATAAAPNAAIEMASCASTTNFGGAIALQNLLNGEGGTLPYVVSMSYGYCEAENTVGYNAFWVYTYQQGASEGVSIFVSSGDEGAASCDYQVSIATHGIGVSGLASTPYNVAVGGTDFGDTITGSNRTYWASSNSPTYGSALSYIPEIPWNNSCAGALVGSYSYCNTSYGADYLTTFAGSGGPSGCATGSPSTPGVVSGTCAGTAKPKWQSGVFGIPNDGVRDIPDLSLFASTGFWGHYYVVCYSDTGDTKYNGKLCTGAPSGWSGGGGTSFASPIMAAIQSLVNQATGEPHQGNPNPIYYAIAAQEYGPSGSASCNSSRSGGPASSCVFYDVTIGDMAVDCTGTVDCYLPSGTYGVLSTSDSAYDPAYGAATGWDFATGIGTVNAYNLVYAWPPGVPTVAAIPGDDRIILNWSVVPTAASYDVYENGTLVASGITGTSADIGGLSNILSYGFYVTAVSSSGFQGVGSKPLTVKPRGLSPDLNGDGVTDLLWYNSTSHETVGYLMSGTTPSSEAQLLTDPNWKILLYADFNGDGNTDLLWYNGATGQTVIWLMNGLNANSQTLVFTDNTLSWKPIAAADLNGDGKADLIWYNTSTGETVGWLMSGASPTSQAQLFTDGSLNWKVIAAADFNGDGKADLLWHNNATGQTVIWLMNGLSIVSQTLIFTDPNLTQWNVTATADLNGDGMADLLWYNSSTGETVGWLMNGATPLSEAQLLTDPHWVVSAPADFNGDGMADLLWHNSATGQTVIWLMNGLNATSQALIFTDSNKTQWNVAATPDLNGDGDADLLWYNSTTGQTVGYLMNGTTITSAAQIFTDSTLSWKTTNSFNGPVVAPGNY